MLKTSPLLVAFTVAALAQTHVETSSPSGRKFSSLPDEKGTVAAAGKALAADPKNPELLLKLAQAQAGVWQNRESAETYTRLLAIEPDNISYLTERGHRELPLREFKKAQADLQKASDLGSKNPDTYYHLGLAHYFQGQFSEAADAFHRSVELAPTTD
ncbi:MAG: tetratricopeptide repeat protein, partial [Acidobacteriaceae bacterium]|nr:tetratricopeptide repeat protein [Acidobacteriaceae bacterium]